MKKSTLLLIGILFLTLQLYGQDTTIIQASKYEYCELVGRMKLMSIKIRITVDYGTHEKAATDLRVKDENGKPIDFVSMVAALNYLGDRGWEFVQAYVVTMPEVGTSGGSNVYHWLLKRPKQPKS